VRPQEPPHRAARRLEFRDARVREPYMTRSWIAPQRRPGDQREAAALYVLAELLGGSGITSVLAQELQLAEGIAIDAGASYSDTGVDPQTFNVYVVPKPDVSLAEAEARLDALLARFVAGGPDPRRLDRIKTRIRASLIYQRDDLQRRARQVGGDLVTGLTLADVEAWPELLQEVTAEEIQAAALAVFRPETSLTSMNMPPETEEVVGQ
jgi:zinc protease